MKICTIAGAAAEIYAADPGSVVIDKSNHDLVDAVQKYLEKTIYIMERKIIIMKISVIVVMILSARKVGLSLVVASILQRRLMPERVKVLWSRICIFPMPKWRDLKSTSMT